jgi:hypothetical protein
MFVVSPADGAIIERLSAVIVRAPRAKRPTVTPKIVVAMDGVKKMKKTWMIKLQQRSLQGV